MKRALIASLLALLVMPVALPAMQSSATPAAAIPVSAIPAAATPAAATGNVSAIRVARGSYRNETIAGGERRGSESFELVVHPDGSRTLSISSDLSSRGAWFTVVLRVAGDFRPLEAYASYWNGGRFKGSGRFVVDGGRLIGEASGPVSGLQRRESDVPARFSIGAHPVSGDGWHTANFDSAGPRQQQLNLYSVEASADREQPVLGKLLLLPVEYVGEETIDVPAGRFVTTRYRLAGMNDLWVHGQDRIVIKSELPARGLRYVLTSLQAQ
ncbi:MAG: hypothetical protein KJS95_10780 [Gammaproteobacteria bacterium]|nr:hypothetical protein [Gammaproteobacteria bacterium]